MMSIVVALKKVSTNSSSFITPDDHHSPLQSGQLFYRKVESLTSSSDDESMEIPGHQEVLELSELTDKILLIDSSTPPDAVIPSPKYKVHLWIEAEFSTEFIVLTQHPPTRDNIFANPADTSQQQETEKDKLIVMFRGSENLDDWLANLNIMLETAKFQGSPQNVKVHRGYQNALYQEDIPARIEDTIFSLFNDTSLNLPSNEVLLSGHSQGGALAHMMGIYLADKYDDFKIDVITFAEPRFGNEALKEWVRTTLSNLTTWRFVYRKDFVPRVIPRFLGYAHTGHLYQFDDSSSAVYYDQTGEKEKQYIGAPRSWYGKCHWSTATTWYDTIIHVSSYDP